MSGGSAIGGSQQRAAGSTSLCTLCILSSPLAVMHHAATATRGLCKKVLFDGGPLPMAVYSLSLSKLQFEGNSGACSAIRRLNVTATCLALSVRSESVTEQQHLAPPRADCVASERGRAPGALYAGLLADHVLCWDAPRPRPALALRQPPHHLTDVCCAAPLDAYHIAVQPRRLLLLLQWLLL